MNTPPPVARPHVLVIDDEEDLCELIALRLEHHGFRVSTEQTSRGGLEVLEREVADAMVLDLQLENENGMDLLSEVQKRSLDLPVIILTAHGTIETAVEAIERGAYGFLTKPFDDHELVQKLNHAVERVRLRREVANLRRMVGTSSNGERLIGTSAAIALVRDLIARVAPSDAPVLIQGESGTGKDVAARTLHALSPRKSGPFITINCAALPEELLERELFGFVGAANGGAPSPGLLATAQGGTLFLDNVADAPPSLQAKLLRVLEERAYLSVGATVVHPADVRLVAATTRSLREAVDAGQFREDLFYRLHVVPIDLPPLRERREDIPLLAELFLTHAAAKLGAGAPHLHHESLHLLMQQEWPGNVRELANVVEGAALLSPDGVLRPPHVLAVLAQRKPSSIEGAKARPVFAPAAPPFESGNPDKPLPLLREAREAFDRAYLEEALRRSGGNVSAAAKLAGRNRTDFHDLLRRHDISAADFRQQGHGARGEGASST